MTEDQESPKEWLHRIMDSSSRESADYDINLLGSQTLAHTNNYSLYVVYTGMFDTVDCHTLFLPATRKHLLQDLSRVSQHTSRALI